MSQAIDGVTKSNFQKKKIAEFARNIRKKYMALKLGRSEEDEALQKLFKPISTPLKQIEATAHSLTKQIDEIHGSPIKTVTDVEVTDVVESKRRRQTEFLPLEDVVLSRIGDSEFHDENAEEEYPTVAPQLENFTCDARTEYIDQYPEISLQYLSEYWDESNEKIDKIYGPNYNPETSVWKLGGTPINFQAHTGNILVGRKQYTGTHGLYQLIFYNKPTYTDADKEEYKDILETTKAHKDRLGRMNNSNTFKYNEIIRPLFRRPLRSNIPKASGSDLSDSLTCNKRSIEYVYWDNPNELVDRLRLLIASKDAGNTSHDNEITAIINELKKANIIS